MRSIAFVDASNLFYGGEKSLGWKIDYQKLYTYLKDKYKVSMILYFGGIEIYKFKFDYLRNETISAIKLERYLSNLINSYSNAPDSFGLSLLNRHLKRARFYLKLEKFGYELHLKPVKIYEQEDGSIKRKANCDVDMAFYLMKDKDEFDRAVILSGDGDFLPVLKYLKNDGKEIIILARGPRAAKEIKQFAGSNFRDFIRLEKYIRFQ
ncbi:MAG: NYN domain-containing protein [Candidatus Pacebacteria bacterium]|nr:NYN domain-containing protein [Candidatus Paceibacterota bacterium]